MTPHPAGTAPSRKFTYAFGGVMTVYGGVMAKVGGVHNPDVGVDTVFGGVPYPFGGVMTIFGGVTYVFGGASTFFGGEEFAFANAQPVHHSTPPSKLAIRADASAGHGAVPGARVVTPERAIPGAPVPRSRRIAAARR